MSILSISIIYVHKYIKPDVYDLDESGVWPRALRDKMLSWFIKTHLSSYIYIIISDA